MRLVETDPRHAMCIAESLGIPCTTLTEAYLVMTTLWKDRMVACQAFALRSIWEPVRKAVGTTATFDPVTLRLYLNIPESEMFARAFIQWGNGLSHPMYLGVHNTHTGLHFLFNLMDNNAEPRPITVDPCTCGAYELRGYSPCRACGKRIPDSY